VRDFFMMRNERAESDRLRRGGASSNMGSGSPGEVRSTGSIPLNFSVLGSGRVKWSCE